MALGTCLYCSPRIIQRRFKSCECFLASASNSSGPLSCSQRCGQTIRVGSEPNVRPSLSELCKTLEFANSSGGSSTGTQATVEFSRMRLPMSFNVVSHDFSSNASIPEMNESRFHLLLKIVRSAVNTLCKFVNAKEASRASFVGYATWFSCM